MDIPPVCQEPEKTGTVAMDPPEGKPLPGKPGIAGNLVYTVVFAGTSRAFA
jgi:hypothetical protein